VNYYELYQSACINQTEIGIKIPYAKMIYPGETMFYMIPKGSIVFSNYYYYAYEQTYIIYGFRKDRQHYGTCINWY
jgi:hypothetical protein